LADLSMHTNALALSVEQQREAVAGLCRVLAAATGDPACRGCMPRIRHTIVFATGKLLFARTSPVDLTGLPPWQHNEFVRAYDDAVAAQAARGGVLKLAIQLLTDPRALAEALCLPTFMAYDATMLEP
jgi:hypothetical protein